MRESKGRAWGGSEKQWGRWEMLGELARVELCA